MMEMSQFSIEKTSSTFVQRRWGSPHRLYGRSSGNSKSYYTTISSNLLDCYRPIHSINDCRAERHLYPQAISPVLCAMIVIQLEMGLDLRKLIQSLVLYLYVIRDGQHLYGPIPTYYRRYIDLEICQSTWPFSTRLFLLTKSQKMKKKNSFLSLHALTTIIKGGKKKRKKRRCQNPRHRNRKESISQLPFVALSPVQSIVKEEKDAAGSPWKAPFDWCWRVSLSTPQRTIIHTLSSWALKPLLSDVAQ